MSDNIDVQVICGACGNANRSARRACTKCNHTGIERVVRVPKKSDGSVSIGGVMPDFGDPEPDSRELFSTLLSKDRTE